MVRVMPRFRNWIRAMSGAGAVENASLACRQRREEEAVIEARLQRIPGPPPRQSTSAA